MNCDDDVVPIWEEVTNYDDDDDDDDNVYVRVESNCGDDEDVRLCERRFCDTFSSRSLILC